MDENADDVSHNLSTRSQQNAVIMTEGISDVDSITEQESSHSCNVEFSHFQNMELSCIILSAIFTNYVEMKYVLVSIDIDVAMGGTDANIIITS